MICVLLATASILTSCFHKCEFASEWSKDDTSHWHKCLKEKCEEISDKSDHVWNEGEITVKATQESDGVKTYTCSVCNHNKEEKVEFTGLSKSEWEEVFSSKTFLNFTYEEETVAEYEGVAITTVVKYKFTETPSLRAQSIITVAGKSETQLYSSADASTLKYELLELIKSMSKYEKYKYDPENKVYKLNGSLTLGSLNSEVKSATIKLKDGKPFEIKYTCNVVSAGKEVECESTITFSSYGKTIVL